MAKAAAVPGLAADDATRDAAVKILWTRFEEMWTLRNAVLKGTDVDAIHDMRVASRRLRTAMQTFRSCFPRRTFREQYDCIRMIADTLGAVRDRDVLINELRADMDQLPAGEQGGVAGLIESLDMERGVDRTALHSLLSQLEASGYDRTFLSYLAQNS
ncbi:MAG TPA: CHAD domain-containing protein [Chloroflexota bacterium]|nr:CHAD domain-containing protein [Chloroflexota bacterium]